MDTKLFKFNTIVMYGEKMYLGINKFSEEWMKIEAELDRKSEKTISEIVSKYDKARYAWNYIRNNNFIKGLWEMSDYIVVGKMQYNAHGDTHARVVAANGLKILNILLNKNVNVDIIKDGIGDVDDANLVVLVSALLHDIGNQVNRKDHNLHSCILAMPILDKLLPQIYRNDFKISQIRACILHAIYTHMEDLKSYTTEASIVKLADGTDITKGRSRLPYDLGNVDIHVISAMSVEDVEIVPGDEKPVEIRIYMTNSAGVFQVEEILYRKLVAGVLTGLVKIVAKTIPEKIETDKRIVRKIVSEKNRFIHIRD